MKRLVYSVIAIVALVFTAQLAQYAWAQRPSNQASTKGKIGKPQLSDTVKANLYADNWFVMYINGELVAVDSIKFMPHNVVSVDILPAYPMTIAVMAKDNADAETGMEYANTQIGDAGFILKFGDGTVTNATWRARAFSHGPIDHDTKNPRVENLEIPENWYAIDFDDSAWGTAKEYTQEQVGPKEPFFAHDFEGAKFIWTDDIELDNTVIFRHVVTTSPDGKSRPDFSNLNDIVPNSPPRKPRR
ncbi:secreted protein [Rhodopirellula maiorica SM1]|uniref:Secreted protein n=1 Tax=Rhodopirellula maiorica SM1 TaxID=1265738 RepID=M5RNI3_9BACT|nr:secreted protein [Rhodopirellula maiorica SM1]